MEVEPGWTASAPRRELPPGECHVWRARGDEPIERWQGLLSADEWSGLKRFHFGADARREAASRGVRRVLLGSYLGRDPLELRFAAGERGKPELVGLGGEREAAGRRFRRFQFNSSHSGDWVLMAVTGESRVGVDVEKHRALERDDVAQRFFHPEEYQEWRLRAPADSEPEFFRLWTMKEAYIKALGLGLAKSLQGFRVSPGFEGSLVSCDDDPSARARWQLRNLPFEPGYAAAIAAEQPVKLCRTFSLR